MADLLKDNETFPLQDIMATDATVG